MVVAKYDIIRRIDAVRQFAMDINGILEFIPGEVKHFKVDGKKYRLSSNVETNEWEIHDEQERS